MPLSNPNSKALSLMKNNWQKSQRFGLKLELEELILSQMAQSKSNAAGLSGRACVMRMIPGEKEVVWDKHRSPRRLNE